MKPYLVFFLLLSFVNCKKSTTTQTTNPEIAFKADGVAYSFKGDWDYNTTTGCTLDPLFFSTVGYLSFVGRTSATLAFEADLFDADVVVKSYSNVKLNCILNSIAYPESKNCSFVITKQENKRVSGIFSGKVYTSTTSTVPVVITNGVFTDVLVR